MAIVSKGSDRWQVVADLGRDDQGRRKRITKIVHGSRRDARRAEAALMRKASSMSPNSTAHTVSDLLDRCLNREPGRLAGTTIAEYRRMAHTRIIPAIGHVQLHKLDPDTLELFYDEMIDEGLSPGSCQKAHTILQGCFKRAVRWGLVESSPMTGVQVPRGPAYRIQPPTPDMVRRLFDVADADEQFGMGLAVRVAALAGLRRGEVLGLQVQDIHATELVVERALAEVRRGGTVVKAPKSNQVRVVPVADFVAKVLGEWAIEARARADREGHVGPVWLFSPHAGHDRPWTPSAWSSRWRRVREQADAVEVRFHDLRHFYATELLDDGIPEATVAVMLGHESIATLQKVYAHHVPVTARRAAQSLGDRLQMG